MFTYRIELNDDMNTMRAPEWAKTERYGYCEDFGSVCLHRRSGFFRKFRNAIMSLMF
jgi:hypothetical protein